MQRLFAAAVIALAAAGIWFRLAHLDRMVFRGDETHTTLAASGHVRAELAAEADAKGILAGEDLEKYRTVDRSRGLGAIVRFFVALGPQHTPLWFIATRLWAERFGDSIAAVRALPALVSLLGLPLFFWLCLELSGSRAVAGAGLALFAVSPYHLLYAREARPYALFTVATLLSSALLLRALRVRTPGAWVLYGLAAAFSLHAFTFSAFVLAGHGAYVIATERERPAKALRAWLAAAAGAAALFSPWIFVIVGHREAVRASTGWLETSLGPRIWLGRVASNLARVFVDFEPWRDRYALPALVLIAAAVVVLVRRAPRRVTAFVLALGAPLALALLAADALGGSQLLATARYLAPALIAVELAVAWLLGSGVAARPGRWAPALAAVAAAGAISCLEISRAEAWWSTFTFTRETDRAVAGAARPLVVANADPMGFTRAVALSYYAGPEVRYWFPRDPGAPLPAGFADVFALMPSAALQRGLEAQGLALELVVERSRLYRVRRRPT